MRLPLNAAPRRPEPLGTKLQYALRGPCLDAFLPELARQAIHPAVRAVAFQTLLRRRASWPVGFGMAWVDKRFGISQRTTLAAFLART